MPDNEIQELHDRNLVPADEIDHLNILRYPPRDPPTVGIFDDPVRCYRANEEWAKHIMGAVTGLQAWKAWTGDEDELNAAVQSIMEFMVGEICSMFLLRQSPTSNCLLEQSVDGGDNWTPAFDFSLCIGGGSDASMTIYINIAITNIATLNQLYIDAGLDITIMYPNVEYDSGPEDQDRNTAMCYAIEALTEGVYNAAEHVINQQINRNGFLSQVIAGLTGGFWASDGSLIAALSQSVVDAIFGTAALEAASDALANTTARRAVVCCIYDNLKDATATYALWQTAGDGCGFAPGSDAALLLSILTPIFAGLDAYLSWVTLLSNGVDLAIGDIIGNDCLECEAWEADRLDGDGHDDLTIVVRNPLNPGLATWSGTILLGHLTGPNKSANGACEASIEDSIITNVTMDIEWNRTIPSAPTDVSRIMIDGVSFATHSNSTQGSGTATLDTGVISETGLILRWEGLARTTTVEDGGYWNITQIHIEGSGVNPFA